MFYCSITAVYADWRPSKIKNEWCSGLFQVRHWFSFVDIWGNVGVVCSYIFNFKNYVSSMCSSFPVTSGAFLCRAPEVYDDKSIENLLLIQFYFPQPIKGRPRPSSSRIPPRVSKGTPWPARAVNCPHGGSGASCSTILRSHLFLTVCFLRWTSNSDLFNPVRGAK